MSVLETWLVYPAPSRRAGDWSPDFQHENISFTAADGVSLHGWLLAHPRPRRWILYCHGNGTHVAHVGRGLQRLRDTLEASIFVFDYRGYGRSEGRPSELGLLADGDAALHWLCHRSGQPATELVLYGRSLGGGVVVDLAARHQPRAIILERTFSRLTDVAAYQFPWLPVRWAMRNRFDSIDKIARYRGAVLLSHGTADTLIPIDQGWRLFEALSSPSKCFLPLDGIGHNDPNPVEYDTLLREFLDRAPNSHPE